MVFIVGQAEHATEKAQLLQQVGQVSCIKISLKWNNFFFNLVFCWTKTKF